MNNNINNTTPNNASVSPAPYLSPLNNIHFLNYLIQPPIPLPPPPSISEIASYCIPDALSERVNVFIKAFDAQINRGQSTTTYLALANFQDSTSITPGFDGLYFHVKSHHKQDPIKIFLLLQDLNNCAEQFFNFIKKSSEIKHFDALTFQILIKLAYMQQNEREFVAASYTNGKFWQKFQSVAKFPSKQNELDFFANLCKFFFIFLYQIQNVNNATTPTIQPSFLLSFPFDYSQVPSMVASINATTTTTITNENPINSVMQNSIIPSLAASQLGIPPSLQLNTLSPQSLSLLLEGLKTFCNSNMSNGNIQIPNIPSLSFPATSTTQGTVAVNQVSPAPSDPIPPIHGSPPKDNNSVNNNLNSNLITCCGPTTVNTQTQGIFSYPTATNTVCGITQLFGLGSNFNQLNHYMNMNMNQNQTLSTTQGVATTITNLTVEPSTSYSSNIIQPEGDIIIAEHEEQHNSPASPSFDDSQEDRNLNSMTFPVVEAIESPDTFTHEIPEETLEEIDQHEQEETEMEMDVSNEETTLNSEPSPLNSEPFDGKTDASSSKKREDEDFIEVDDFEPKVECHVPIQALSTLPERQRIAPLKINLKLLRASRQPQPKPIKRKSSHKSRKSYKEDDDDNDSDNDNEYKSRIKTEDFDSFDTCYTDPLALRKIQRKTSSQIKQEHETFIEQIYNQPDDKKKLKVVYPNVQAEIIYNPGDYVTKFIGDIVTSRSVYNQNKDNPFLIEIGRNKWIDGKDRRSFGVYILPAEVPHQANTTIKLHTTKKNIVFVGFYATQIIYPGEFLYFKR